MKKSTVTKINELIVSIEAKLKFRNRTDKEKFRKALKHGPIGMDMLDISEDTKK